MRVILTAPSWTRIEGMREECQLPSLHYRILCEGNSGHGNLSMNVATHTPVAPHAPCFPMTARLLPRRKLGPCKAGAACTLDLNVDRYLEADLPVSGFEPPPPP